MDAANNKQDMELSVTSPTDSFDSFGQAHRMIQEANHIYIISQESHEAQCVAMALFYILKESNKNANFVASTIPENLKFLAPSLDFISYPKNFVISIPTNVADISKVYFEKNTEALKIHLLLEHGKIKKEDASFYFSEPKPDLVITINIQDYVKELEERLNPFGFLLGTNIINIDNNSENKKFGTVNLVTQKSLAELILNATASQNINKKVAECFLASIVLHTNGFKKNITAEIFEMAGLFMKKGADLPEINNHLHVT